MPLRESRLRSRYGVTVVSVKRQIDGRNARFNHATPESVLMYGDIILVLGRIDDVEAFANAN